ncbi:hypothetical protein GRJ2_001927600 [Grus japonensis]|uniref:Uncharacterized protein n=1 Tax=Grus japonensis TaxID=30415 RepID=A0ABC9XAB1_GRUJA
MNPILLLLLSSGLSGRRCRDFEEDPWLFLMAEQAGDEQAVSWIGAISLGHFYIREALIVWLAGSMQEWQR